MPNAFSTWCAFLTPTEGGLSLDPNDSGNFTPDGRLVGTKFGISAHSYPSIDIPNLTIDAANQLRKTDFWDKVRGDEVPGSVAFVLAEAAYGSGPGRAIMQLQNVVGVKADGAFGQGTMDALTARLAKQGGVSAFVVEYQAQRLLFEAALGTKWENYRVGWTRRLFGGMAVSLGLDGAAPTPPTTPTTPTTPTSTPSTDLMAAQLRFTLADIVARAQAALDALPTPVAPASNPDNSSDDLNATELAKVQSS